MYLCTMCFVIFESWILTVKLCIYTFSDDSTRSREMSEEPLKTEEIITENEDQEPIKTESLPEEN